MKKILFATTCLIPILTFAAPENLEVVGGAASITTSADTTTINQITDRAAFNCTSFDTAAREAVKFQQPSSNSQALVRVNSPNPTYYNGQLIANGNVILVNQNGIFFGKTAVVDVNGLIASTIDIDTNQFMNGVNKLEFNKPINNHDAKIVNDGTIKVKEAGLVGLVGQNVTNNGLIIANSAQVTLASGDNFTVDLYGDKLLEVAVSNNLKKQLIENKGMIQADGGKVIITAAAGREIVDSLINIEGEISTRALINKQGEIVIYNEGSNAVKNNIAENKGKKTGQSAVVIAAKLDASNEAGGKAGKITVTADNVTLTNKAQISANGTDGDIKIGGDYLGGGNTPAALKLNVEKGAQIFADSTKNGDAGRIIFWSDETTKFAGKAYARALGYLGNGGFIETSGKKYLTFDQDFADIDTRAKNGKRGKHFLDPDNIVIYGNVSPTYVSTASSDIPEDLAIKNLNGNLKLYLDASNLDSMELNYQQVVTLTNDGNDTNVFNVADGSKFKIGERVKFASSNPEDVNAASDAGYYTVTNVSMSPDFIDYVVTLSDNVSFTAGSFVYGAYVKNWNDLSGNSYNASQSASNMMPLLLTNIKNGLPVLSFDGTSQGFDVYLGFMNDPTFGYAGVPHTNIISAKTLSYGSFYQSVSAGGNFYEGFNHDATYRSDYMLGGDLLGNFVQSGSVTPSASFRAGDFNIIAMEWLPDSPYGADYALNTRYVYANTHKEVTSSPAGTLGPYGGSATIANGDDGTVWGGEMSEMLFYTSMLSNYERNLVSQYESAKWDIATSPPGSFSGGAGSEAQKATASTLNGAATDGYSVFSTKYLNRLSSQNNIELVAATSIVFDLQGDKIEFANNTNFSLSANNILSTGSSGLIKTSGTGGITMYSKGNLNIPDIQIQAGGTVALYANMTGLADTNPTFNPNMSSAGNFIINYADGSILSHHIHFDLTATNRAYDATRNVVIPDGFSRSGGPTGVGLLGSSPSGIVESKNIGTAIPVTLEGLSFEIPRTNATYTYIAPGVTVDITKADLLVTGLGVSDKIYDATTDASITGSPTYSVFGSDDVSILGAPTAMFPSKNAGIYSVAINGLSLSGTDASNYNIDVAGVVAAINPANLPVTGYSITTKTYDATTDANVVGTPVYSVLGSDDVSILGVPTAIFPSKNVGTYSSLAISGLSLGGTDRNNYNINVADVALATINPALLTVKADDKTILQNSSIPPLTYTYSGQMSGEIPLFAGALFYGGSNQPGIREIEKGDLEALDNYRIGTYIPGVISVTALPTQSSVSGASPAIGSILNLISGSMALPNLTMSGAIGASNLVSSSMLASTPSSPSLTFDSGVFGGDQAAGSSKSSSPSVMPMLNE